MSIHDDARAPSRIRAASSTYRGVCGAAVVGVVAGVGLAAATPQSSTLTPRQILTRMAKTYATCASYQDSGVVKTVFAGRFLRFTSEEPFTTAFERPDRFRYEFFEKGNPWSHYIIWADGNQIRAWWDVYRRIETPPSLGEAVAGATGVSDGSAQTIPSLLLPDKVDGVRLTELKNLRLLPSANLDGVRCFRLAGELTGNSVTLWVDAETFLIRRIDEHETSSAPPWETTTTYAPIVNAPVRAEDLAFGVVRRIHAPFLQLDLRACEVTPFALLLGVLLGYAFGRWSLRRYLARHPLLDQRPDSLTFVYSKTGETIPSTVLARIALPVFAGLPWLVFEVVQIRGLACLPGSDWVFECLLSLVTLMLAAIIGCRASGLPRQWIGGAPVFSWPHDKIAWWQHRRRQRRRRE